MIFTGKGGASTPVLLPKIGNNSPSWVKHSRHISERFKAMLYSSVMFNTFPNENKHYQHPSYLLPFCIYSVLTTGNLTTAKNPVRRVKEVKLRRPVSNLNQVLWDLWMVKWYWGSFYPTTSVFPCQFSSTTCSIWVWYNMSNNGLYV
jgi:hypothetical protein